MRIVDPDKLRRISAWSIGVLWSVFSFVTWTPDTHAAVVCTGLTTACGGTTLNWVPDAGTTTWNTTGNWNTEVTNLHSFWPNSTAYNVCIRSDWTVPDFAITGGQSPDQIGCLHLVSGTWNATPAAARSLSVRGSYFRNLVSNSITTNANMTISMDSTTVAQTYENVDNVNRLTITNNTAGGVQITRDSTISTAFTISAGTKLVQISSTLIIPAAAALTVPTGATLEIMSGGVLVAQGGLSVTGTLKIDGGGKLSISNGKTLTVNSGGVLQLAGTSGNPAAMDAYQGGTNTYGVTIASGGTISFNNFSISRTTAAGVSVASGATVSQVSNGDFHFIANNGGAMTLMGTPASISTTWTGVGFYNDAGNATTYNLILNSAPAYVGSVITLNNWNGAVGGATHSNPASSAKLTWGSQASASLQITDNTSSSGGPFPPVSIAAGSAATLFGTMGFSFTNTTGSPSTDITSIKLTFDGTNTASDIQTLQVYLDANANCTWEAGTDTLVSSSQISTITGSPPTATVTLNSGQFTVNSTTPKCIHAVLTISSGAQGGNTIAVKVAATTDVSNSGSYSFSNSATPPITWGTAAITSTTTLKTWNGGNSGTWWNGNTADWTTTGFPATVAPFNDCQVGSAYSIPTLRTSPTCRNMTFASGGTLNFGAAFTLNIQGAANIDSSSFTFTQTSGSPTLNFNGTSTQSISGGVAFPGAVTVAASSGVAVNLNGNWTVNSLTITSGNFTIASGVTLTVAGNVTVNGANAKLIINPGGTLKFSVNGSTLTVTNGTLTLIGSASQSASITSSSTATAYTIAVNGTSTIQAQYYSLSNLGTPGLTVASTATIDPTYYLQNGSFSCPIGSGTLLKLNRRIPPGTSINSDILDGMVFDKAGCSATATPIDISGVSGAPAGSLLSLTNYSGDNAGSGAVNNATYAVSWGTASNTIRVSRNANATFASVSQGDTAKMMGKWSFQQTPGGTQDTDISALKVTLMGTASASDITAARLYYDPACNGTGTTQMGSTLTFSGSPPTANFSGLAAGFTIPYAPSGAPTAKCVYVEYDFSASATVGATAGAEIAVSADVSNTRTYSFQGGYTPPVILYNNTGSAYANITASATTITWTGASSNVFTLAGNWNPASAPSSTLTCIINSGMATYPTLTAAASCKNVTIAAGATLTLTAPGNLSVYGSFSNSGTFTNAGTLTLADGGAGSTSQVITSSSAISGLAFNKTSGGTISIGNSVLTVNNLTFPNAPAGQNFTFQLGSGDTLYAPNGIASIAAPSVTFQLGNNSTLSMGSGTSITVNGGKFKVAATNSNFTGTGPGYTPTQTYANSGTVSPTTAGTRWGFSATSGTVDLTGAILDSINTSGLNISGSTNVLTLNAVQFLNLLNGGTAALQLNNTGGLVATANNMGFNFGAALNSYYSVANPAPPAPASSYNLVITGASCSGSLTLSNWFGDFYQDLNTPLNASPTAGYKYTQGACAVTFTRANSPVALTHFAASPFRDAIVLDWTTGLEWQHRGFNVYRSLSPDGGYAQINSGLIRNTVATGSIHGRYQFYDRSVQSGATYYYQIEDISTTGTRTLHGPLSATSLPTLALAPAPDPGAYQGIGSEPVPSPTASPSPAPADPFSAGETLLAPGVKLLAKTAHSLRLRIDVPAFTTSAAEQSPYVRVAMPGYSLTTSAGLPELPERVIMVEIPAAGMATATLVSRSHSILSPLDIAPANQWTPVNGTLVPSWSLDSAFYSTAQLLPAQPMGLGAITQSQGRTYLPVIIQPLSYNPVTREVDSTTQLTLDIDLSGSPLWNVGGVIGSAGPWAQEGALKIHVKSEGLYKLSYEDLALAGVDGPFLGADVTRLRLYKRTEELPLHITGGGASFGPGSTLHFFAPYTDSPETDRNTFLLVVDTAAGARMTVADGTPGGAPVLRASGSYRTVSYKQPLMGYFGQAYGENLDHVIWGIPYASTADTANSTLHSSINLPHLIQDGAVTLNATLKGNPGYLVANGIHHLRIAVNGTPYPDADVLIPSNDATVATFVLPASAFVAGTNTVDFQVVGDLFQGDYDSVIFEHYTATYPHTWSAESDKADFSYVTGGMAVRVDGFSGTDLTVFDVTDPAQATVLTGADVVTDTGVSSAKFVNPLGSFESDRRVWVVRESMIPLPYAVELNAGSNLRATTNSAEVLFVGPAPLLSAIAPLVELRRQQGFSVQVVDLESVYAEFGLGDRSAAVLKSFLQHAATQWQTPSLKYVVLVGDGTYDPKNQLGYGGGKSFAPIHLLAGQYWDYASDNWFVSFNPSDQLPSLAIGRIPGSTPSLIATYVNKVLSYESGAARPTGSRAAAVTLINDVDQIGGEGFSPRAGTLAGNIPAWNNSLSVSRVDRSSLNDVQIKNAILNAFDAGPMLLHYLGHGAENIWASTSIFTNSEADQLTNLKLPIVITMDCMNGRFFEAVPTDPAYQSISDRLLFNPIGGAIATWASTSQSSPQDQSPYQDALYEVIAKNPGIRLGEAIRLAKLQVGWSPARAETLGSWTLLGDPLIQVNVPAAQSSASSSSSEKSGGFLSCGTTRNTGGKGGRGNLPGGGVTVETGLLLLVLIAGRKFLRRLPTRR